MFEFIEELQRSDAERAKAAKRKRKQAAAPLLKAKTEAAKQAATEDLTKQIIAGEITALDAIAGLLGA
jgi:hypothetical protein